MRIHVRNIMDVKRTTMRGSRTAASTSALSAGAWCARHDEKWSRHPARACVIYT